MNRFISIYLRLDSPSEMGENGRIGGEFSLEVSSSNQSHDVAEETVTGYYGLVAEAAR